MRKVLLSAIVIFSFVTYTFSVKPKAVATTPVIPPTNLANKKLTISPTLIPTATPVLPKPTVAHAKPTLASIPPTATPQPVMPTATPKPSSPYKDGTFTGDVADAFYGPLQVQATISGGRITNVSFLQAPNDNSNSIAINQQADPMLAQEAIQAQSANVDIISGATASSQAFVQSMQSALNQAKS